jgi:hypothetical protein
MQALRERIEQGEIDPSFVISYRYRLMLSLTRIIRECQEI